jgi:hypothetical protein
LKMDSKLDTWLPPDIPWRMFLRKPLGRNNIDF